MGRGGPLFQESVRHWRQIAILRLNETDPYPAADRAALPHPRRLVPDRACYGRTTDGEPILSAFERNQHADDGLFRGAGGAWRVIRLVQHFHPPHIPDLCRRLTALFLVQLLVCVRRARVQSVDGARLYLKRSNAWPKPVGLADQRSTTIRSVTRLGSVKYIL